MATTTTSSSSAPARAAARSRTGSRRPASASCCSSAAATCRASPRTGTPRRSSARSATCHGEQWIDKDGERVPARTSSTSSAATRSSTARSSSACASATSARCATTAASRPRGRSPTTTSSPTTPRPSGSTSCTARPARTRPSRRRSGPFPYPAVSHEPRIQQLHDDFVRTGHHPFHLPVGVDLDESDPEAGRCVRCDRFDGFPCLTDGKADAHVLLRAPGARAHERHAAHARARSSGWRPTRAGARSPRSSSTAAAREERYSADVVVVSCGAVELGRAAAALGHRPAPERARQLLRRRRAATTWPTSTRA